MRSFKFAACAGSVAVLAAAGSAAFAQSPDLLPTGPWELNQAAESCYITRDFTGGGRSFRLRIQSYGEETPYHVALIGDGVPVRNQRSEAVKFRFGPIDDDGTALGLLGQAADGRPMITVAGYPARPTNLIGWIYTGAERFVRFGEPVEADAETLAVETEGMDPVTLRIAPMAAELDLLDDCTRTLEQKWQAAATGGSADQPVSAPQLLNPQDTNWHTKYPENLLLNRISGLVDIRMTVDAQGRAHDCVVQSSLWAKQLGEVACANFERWRHFEPAKDAAGKPVAALYRTSILYAIYAWS
ncbi:MAG: energy transducer TonB [Novosphingobium sp.]|nr:energy transducer TonB [Novosphingobium sp.]